ncbi:MAG: hypothetical protein F4X72_04465 [Dehalococcoidia bacterium]|nr:hypothetical protein [Dehalococcoidia bacterium]
MSEASMRGPVLILITEDITRAIEYYRDTLGFELANAKPEDDPTWCLLKRDDVRIMFLGQHEHGDEEDGHNHDDEGQDHQHAPGVNSLYFYPDNVDALWDQLKDKIEVEVPLQDMDYGMREFTIRDPNGYALNFGTPNGG